ncbi:UDP-N-acetylglucosamine 4-epimerase [Acetobacter nitrogenifigens DSM 23921 = NBRC 105050]|uniref:UDP-N-acetylglucosamine 4-epimerase n=1 Tax=Acetobacter nitrogenifigens DSM 23921 = NBRC 105050 TaxID=1120919 RepID=A0A511X8J7_9PROT|nr:SDR family NAD(P)-dependent oxidoreductase [Acetobacter nitrogenifigens]GBQ91853.1 UDP-N-acetylglucosamine 4-epimerase [Acetobacter nitrogenifigens DSM 23921 = NBRC 105050]GEN59251.1 UDP-N-acetylglucosamine 4-epimerase [Acetobacter nitrogenifigens DSM 23921 = NBRC 105050]
MTILVTGAAGFIGAHVCKALLARGARVVGVDNLNDYYDPQLKRRRLARLTEHDGFTFCQCDIAEQETFSSDVLGNPEEITEILHLAAQAGVRYSMEDPFAFVKANILGHVTLLEFARRLPKLRHFVYASSSSVYGRNEAMPFRESDRVDHPGSFYAATKRAGELASDCYQYLYGIPQTGLRFFTVYGPWGRPDMAYFKFAEAIMRGESLTLYDGSALARDFTYIDDVVEAVLAVLDAPPDGCAARLLNVGNSRPTAVRTMVGLLEDALGRKTNIQVMDRPAADVESTWASIDKIRDIVGWEPKTDLADGIRRFATWFVEYRETARHG